MSNLVNKVGNNKVYSYIQPKKQSNTEKVLSKVSKNNYILKKDRQINENVEDTIDVINSYQQGATRQRTNSLNMSKNSNRMTPNTSKMKR